MYIHLTTHSAFSLQEGLMSPTELAQAAVAAGMPAIGLTDHHLLTGTIEFVTACKADGLQPIPGLEIQLNDGPLQLLATSLEGWSNLCRLSSTLLLREDPAAPCPLDVLDRHAKDLIALSSQPELIHGIFPDRLYASLLAPNQIESLSKLARRLKIPAVVTHPVYYQNRGQAALQRTLAAVRLNTTLSRLPGEIRNQ